MNATPRVRSGGFPQTPGTVAPRARREPPSPSQQTKAQQQQFQSSRPSLPPAPENRSAAAVAERPPLIPLTVIDAPTQRFYAVAIYIALLAYRFWDWIYVVEEDAGSFLLFGKWLAIDFAFLFIALPSLRIPWLDLSQPVAISVFFAQSVLNWILMFNIQVYWTTWLLGVVKIFYDRELSISEHNVKVSSILHNSSLIMGKQIINILPEGSALLNPEKIPYCVGQGKSSVVVPLYFNATIPAEVELLRIDLETNAEEVVKLSKSQIREIDRQAKKITEDGATTSYRYDVPIKKVGAYRLHKVLDEYKLEVQRITEPTYVVPCPKAQVRRADSSTRCLNDLSNLALDVHGTPPLKIVYSRTINGKDHSFHFQSLQPDGFSSPLLGAGRTSSMVLTEGEDVTWARAQYVAVALNESMGQAGEWRYSIDEVHDVFGNVVTYAASGEDGEVKPKPKHLTQNFVVRERPQAILDGCDLRSPLKVAKGLSTQLPVRYSLPGQGSSQTYTLSWQFSPIDTLTKSGDHGDVVEMGTFTAKNAQDRPTISAPGLYTLKTISCDSCEGEIEEPSSCLLLNPLEPKLTITAEGIPAKCASSSIGLRVDLDLVGTPPFKVFYDITSTERHRTESVVVKGLRQQIDLLPRNAGRYQYRFRSIQDAVYSSVNLPLTDEYTLEQNVKPPATAYFENQSEISACLDQQVEVDVTLLGDGPFTLEWELVHNGHRDTKTVTDIDANSYKIQTAPLTKGGDYTIALKSIKDKTGCSVFLKEETSITVRRQRPRAAFGTIEKKRAATVVEEAAVGIPLRLSGEGPWQVSYRNIDSGRPVQVKKATSNNDFIQTTERGTFEIVDVMDNQCPGQVDPEASKFEVSWFPRPEISVVPTDTISENRGVFVKQEVCEGDIDGFEVALKGELTYSERLVPVYLQVVLTRSQELRRTAWPTRSNTSPSRAPAPWPGRNLTRRCPRHPSPWTRARPASTRTSSRRWKTTCTTTTRGSSSPSPWNSGSTRSPPRRLPSPDRYSRCACRSRSTRRRSPSRCRALRRSTSRLR